MITQPALPQNIRKFVHMVCNIIKKECLNTPHTALKWHQVTVIRFSALKQNLGDYKLKGKCEVTTAVT